MPLKYVTQLGTPKFVVVHAYIGLHYVFKGRFVLIRGVFVWKVLYGVVFVRPLFCQNASVTTES